MHCWQNAAEDTTSVRKAVLPCTRNLLTCCIDVGASELVADGSIKVKQGSGIARYTSKGLVFDDGAELDADVVVFATG